MLIPKNGRLKDSTSSWFTQQQRQYAKFPGVKGTF